MENKMTTPKSTFIVRKMTRKELDLAIEWAAKEGWNPGLYDAEAFYAADPQGYYIGLLNDEPIGVVSAISYDENYGFVGFYIIKPEHRGKRYGLILLNAAMQHLEGKNVGTDGVLHKQQTYSHLFGMKFAYKNVRYEGIARKATSKNTVELKTIPFKDVLEYDTMMFPAKRESFLKEWIKQPENYSLATTKNNKLTGFGVIRKCHKGYKIGPIFADNKEYAQDIFNGLISNIEGETFYFDSPEANPDAIKIAEDYNMEVVFGTARMYLKEQPDIPIHKLFGVTTFELG